MSKKNIKRQTGISDLTLCSEEKIMPMYEYKCKCNSENITTVVRSIKDTAPEEKCKLCGNPMQRVFSPVGIVFKGSGFTGAAKGSM